MNDEIEKTIKELWTSIDKLYKLYNIDEHSFELGRLEYIRRNILKLQKKNKGTDEHNCCFCNKPNIRFGNNPEPLMLYPNRCCDDCNVNKVIPERLKQSISNAVCNVCGTTKTENGEKQYCSICDNEGKQNE